MGEDRNLVWAIIGKVSAILLLLLVLNGLIKDTVRQDWELEDLQHRIAELEQRCR